MTEVLGKRFRFKWMVKDQGALCHQMRCDQPAVSHRLCAKHGAYWLSRGQQPPMPDYENGRSTDVVETLQNEALDAARERKAMSALPMRSHEDARVMRDQLVGARALIEQTREKKDATVRPLLAEARRLERAYDEVIAAYQTCEELALERLAQFEHLHDFEVAKPSKSGFPPAPQADRRSAAPKKKTGRGKGRTRA